MFQLSDTQKKGVKIVIGIAVLTAFFVGAYISTSDDVEIAVDTLPRVPKEETVSPSTEISLFIGGTSTIPIPISPEQTSSITSSTTTPRVAVSSTVVIAVSTSTPSQPSRPMGGGSSRGGSSSGSGSSGGGTTVPPTQPVTPPTTPTTGNSSRPSGGSGTSSAQPVTNPGTPLIVPNILPTVSFVVDPTAPSTFSIFANAADSDGTVLRVEFFNGATLLGEDTTAPYRFTWSNVSPGTYSLTARATDNRGGQTTSGPVSVSMQSPVNTPPTVSLTAVSSISAPATVTLNATASDSDGVVSRVEFYNGSTRLGDDVTFPYSFSWSNVGAGTYTFTAHAVDNRGNTTISLPVTVTIAGVSSAQPVTSQQNPTIATPNVNPTVYLTTLSSISAPATVTLNANAADSDGTITTVEFYNNSIRLGEDTTAPFSFTLSSVPAGTYSFTARATDNRGGQTVSSPMPVSIAQATNVNPAISLTTVSSLTAPGTITMSVNASDSDGTITRVEFFNDGVYLTEDTTAPYSYIWTSIPAGTYTITVRATDDRGGQTTSAPRTITIEPVNNNPTVSVTVNSSRYAPATVTLTATASDSDGTISVVDFYNDSTFLGGDVSAPYTFTWSNVAAGTYTFTARATDNRYGRTTSVPTSITIEPYRIPNPQPGSGTLQPTVQYPGAP